MVSAELCFLVLWWFIASFYRSAPSLHSAPGGDARQKKMRRRRSKSPGNNKRPPDELKKYIEFEYLEPTQDFTEDQLKEIPYMNVE